MFFAVVKHLDLSPNFLPHALTALPPVFVPTNIHHDIPAVLPSLAEDTLPENVILPSGDPPQAFPG